jgi:hypothetical protein
MMGRRTRSITRYARVDLPRPRVDPAR